MPHRKPGKVKSHHSAFPGFRYGIGVCAYFINVDIDGCDHGVAPASNETNRWPEVSGAHCDEKVLAGPS